MKCLTCIVLLYLLAPINSWGRKIKEDRKEPSRFLTAGRAYIFWGWNRGWYTDSDIRFQGTDYDFTLKSVKATDKQTPFDAGTYFHPLTISIPQTNLKIGYFINDNWDIAWGYDHMKYVVVRTQETTIDGFISNHPDYQGVYNAENFHLDEDFLKYEHTDGLNYMHLELTYNKDLFDLPSKSSILKNIELNYLVGAGGGIVMPKSNVTLMDKPRKDAFHLAGYGLGAKVGLNLTLYRFLFFRSEYKAGFINLPDVVTSSSPDDRAEQHFFFTQLNFVFGFTAQLWNWN